MTSPTATPVDVADAPPAVADAPPAAPVLAAPPTPDIDTAAMLAQIQALQARVDSMSQAAGVPADPMAAAVKNLRDHVTVRTGSLSSERRDEFTELATAVGDLSDAPTADDADLIRVLLDETRYFEGRDYCVQLARDLHKLILKEKPRKVSPAKSKPDAVAANKG